MSYPLVNIVDRLADVSARIAALQTEAAALKGVLIASGAASVDGSLHRATISLVDGRKVTDWRAVAAVLQPSRQLVAAHTAVGEPYYSVRLFGRTAAPVAVCEVA